MLQHLGFPPPKRDVRLSILFSTYSTSSNKQHFRQHLTQSECLSSWDSRPAPPGAKSPLCMNPPQGLHALSHAALLSTRCLLHPWEQPAGEKPSLPQARGASPCCGSCPVAAALGSSTPDASEGERRREPAHSRSPAEPTARRGLLRREAGMSSKLGHFYDEEGIGASLL